MRDKQLIAVLDTTNKDIVYAVIYILHSRGIELGRNMTPEDFARSFIVGSSGHLEEYSTLYVLREHDGQLAAWRGNNGFLRNKDNYDRVCLTNIVAFMELVDAAAAAVEKREELAVGDYTTTDYDGESITIGCTEVAYEEVEAVYRAMQKIRTEEDHP